jgi:1,4-alpha-glucan branching enzyme
MRMRSWLPLLLALTAASAACAARTPLAPAITADGVRFVLEQAGAHSVAVSGTFNEWSATSHPLALDGGRRRWTAVVALPPGEHLFIYVVDGAWITPPYADDYMDDGFGSRNGVVVVPPAER